MPNLIKTRIYIDGFNFYYGAVKDTPYKWLDVPKFINLTLGEEYKVDKVLYFTARVKPWNSTDKSHQRQDVYFRALQAMYPDLISFHYGHFLTAKKHMRLADNPDQWVEVIKTEEKGSDVNLTANYLNDAWKNNFDCGIIVSNDGDMAEALKLTAENFPDKERGIIVPIDLAKQAKIPKQNRRKVSKELMKYVDKNRVRSVRESLLKQSQFPDQIPNSNIYKPIEW